MNKAQLIDLLSQRLGGDKRGAATAVEGVVDIVVRTVQSGENVTITGFGVFEKRDRAARVARNPRTGETVRVAPTSVPSFRAGTNFKAVVSGAADLPADAPAVKRATASRRVRPAAATAQAAATARSSRTATSGPKTAAAKTAAKAAAASAPPKAPKAEKPAKGKKVTEKKKAAKAKK